MSIIAPPSTVTLADIDALSIQAEALLLAHYRVARGVFQIAPPCASDPLDRLFLACNPTATPFLITVGDHGVLVRSGQRCIFTHREGVIAVSGGCPVGYALHRVTTYRAATALARIVRGDLDEVNFWRSVERDPATEIAR